jgi:hypothetical protein
MIRRLTFGLIFLTALAVVACGRQVTPNPVGVGPLGALPGQMAVTFDVAQPFNFSNYQYWIVFNTSGNGLTPDTQPYNNNWAAYSEGIEITGNGGATSARAFQFVKNLQNPHITPTFQPLPTTPQQLQYNLNSNGSGAEFSVIFQRSVFIGIQPSPLPLATPWLFNAFTTQADVQGNLLFVDSMGGATGGAPPPFVSPVLNTWRCFDTNPITAISNGRQVDPSAQIVSVEIANNPSPTPSVTPSAVPCSSDGGDARGVIDRITK